MLSLKKLSRASESPSIRDALSGKPDGNNLSAKEQHEIYTANNLADDFTESMFIEKWNNYLSTVESPNLKFTLSTVPEFSPDYKFTLRIENTVQEENIKAIKPELVAFLRKELKNSSIEVISKIVETKGEKMIYSDDEKYADMAKKNPDLVLLRHKFNLDFGD